jgi:hypothetical protein
MAKGFVYQHGICYFVPLEVNPMAEPNPIFDAIDEEAEKRALAEAEADIAAGRVVPHNEVVAWLESWGKPDELPYPVARESQPRVISR